MTMRSNNRPLPVAASASPRRAVWLMGVAVLLSALGARMVQAEAGTPDLLRAYPGRMVDLGGYALHIDCRGHGQPLVVLESGLGGLSLEWHAVQRELAVRTRTCVYDRAGYGWSDAGPLPRTAAQSAAELHRLLLAAGEKPPFVLAAHSYGGFIARLYAARYAEEVAAVVLLDASAPEQFAELPADLLPGALMRALGSGRRTRSIPLPPASVLPAHRTLAMQLMMLPKARLAYASELESFEYSARRVEFAARTRIAAPVMVLSRGRSAFGDSPQAQAAERTWQLMQRRMTGLSDLSWHWTAPGAGHVIHADRPDLVTAAVAHAGSVARLPAGVASDLHLVDVRPGHTANWTSALAISMVH